MPKKPLQLASDDPDIDDKGANYLQTANEKQRFRYMIMTYIESIRKYNSIVKKLVESGFTETSIDVFFDARYIDLQNELNKLYEGSNVQTSAGKSIGEIPVLDPTELEALINLIFGNSAQGNARSSQIIGSIRTRTANQDLMTQVLNSNVDVFTDVGWSNSMIQTLVEQIQKVIGIPFAKDVNGKAIAIVGVGIKALIFKEKDDKAKKDLITAVLNLISNNAKLMNQITKLKRDLSTTTNTADKIMMTIVEIAGYVDNKTLLNIRAVVKQYLRNIIQKTGAKNPAREWIFDEQDTIIKPDEDLTKTKPVEDSTYTTIADSFKNDLTDEQRNLLIRIISQLSQKVKTSDQEMKDDQFSLITQTIFSELIQSVKMSEAKTKKEKAKAETKRARTTNKLPEVPKPVEVPGLMSRVFNYIISNSDTISEIANLIINPTPVKIKEYLNEIINSAKSKPINESISEEKYKELQGDTTESVATSSGTTNIPTEQEPSLQATTPEALPAETATSTTSQLESKYDTRSDSDIEASLRNFDYRAFVNGGFVNGEFVDTTVNEVIQELTEEEKKILNDELNELDLTLALINKITEEESKFLNDVSEKPEDVSSQSSKLADIIEKKKKSKPQFTRLKKILQAIKKYFGKFSIGRVVELPEGGIEMYTIENANRGTIRYGLITEEDDEVKYPEGGPPGPPDDEPPDGGDPSGPSGPRRGRVPRRAPRRTIRSLTKRQWILLLIIIAIVSTGVVSLDEIFKRGSNLKDDGTTTKPTPVPGTGTETGTGTDGISKIGHTDFWDSVGLGDAIDTYNDMIDKYNNIPKKDRDAYLETIKKYYNKFSEATNSVELKDLQKARSRYDEIKYQYDQALANGLSFDRVNAIYFVLKDSIKYLNDMTDKYVDIENGRFGWSKTKDSPDVTIDDTDTNIFDNKTTLDKGNKKSIVDTGFSIMSKGMRERIARKLAGKGDKSNAIDQEQQDFINFSTVKPLLGTDYTNPLIRINKEYEYIQYNNCNKNPKYKPSPTINKLIKNSKQSKPKLYNDILIDDVLNYDTGNKLISQKLYAEHPTQFNQSRLFNPEYNLEQINKQKTIKTNSDIIGRHGPYYGLPHSENQYYQYGNIQYKQNDKLNQYPETHVIKMSKRIKRILPNSYSLK